MAYPSYTKCVSAAEYKQLDIDLGILATIAAAITGFFFPPVALVALLAALFTLKAYLDHILDGKLICLYGGAATNCPGEDQVALGTVVSFAPPGWKPWTEAFVDNDFGINLILFPLRLGDFVLVNQLPEYGGRRFELHRGAFGDKFFPKVDQGYLVGPTPAAALPSDATANEGHWITIPASDSDALAEGSIEALPGDPNPAAEAIGGVDPKNTPSVIEVDVLHGEIEGARGYLMREAIDQLRSLGLGGGVCEWKVFGIPVGRAICAIGMTILAPLIWAKVIHAYIVATPGNPGQVLLNPADGELHPGDLIIMKGRWVQDADVKHGWHELHPVKAIQKVRPRPRPAYIRTVPESEFIDTDAWQRLSCEVPDQYWTDTSAHGAGGAYNPPPKPKSMTPEQEKVYAAQAQPENTWIVHPALDGCIQEHVR